MIAPSILERTDPDTAPKQQDIGHTYDTTIICYFYLNEKKIFYLISKNTLVLTFFYQSLKGFYKNQLKINVSNTCQSLSQSKGIGNAPTQAPTRESMVL